MSDKLSQEILDECASEPIHLIGSIRPSGCLLGVHKQNLSIQFVSENIHDLFPVSADKLVGAPLRAFVPEMLAKVLIPIIRSATKGEKHTERFRWNPDAHEKVTLVHLCPDDQTVLIEILLQDDPVSDVTDRLQNIVNLRKLGEITDLGALMDQVAERIRRFTEFDRVMVYRFNDDTTGYVAAESSRADLESFLGLHYPGGDIPAQARKLFIDNRVRMIENVGYTPVKLLAHHSLATDLDLSNAALRGVSPIHLRYLSNMGVAGSLSISLIRDGQLWGMIACHHYSPKSLSPSMLSLTEMLSQVLSVMADRLDRLEHKEYSLRCHDAIDSAMAFITDHNAGIQQGLIAALPKISNAIYSDGIAMIQDGHWHQVGETPNIDQLNELIDWLTTGINESLYVTNNLSSVWQSAEPIASSAGLIAIRRSEADSWLLIFRSEIVRSIFWAGDPSQAVLRDADGRLNPRGSFEAWKDEVRGQCKPWHQAEIDSLKPLRRFTSLIDQRESAGSTIQTIDPLMVVSLEGKIIDWNYALERHFDTGEFEGKHLTLFAPIADQPVLKQLLKNAAVGQVWKGEFEDTTGGIFEVLVYPLQEPGTHDRVAVSLKSVSEQRLLESQLQHAQRMEALGQLTGGLTHNFNNLLTVILSSTSLALDKLNSGEPGYDELEAAHQAGLSAARLVRDLMLFNHQNDMTRQATDIRKLVQNLSNMLKNFLTDRVKLAIEIKDDDKFTVKIDYSSLEQVLVNLIINARDAIGGAGLIGVQLYREYVGPERSVLLNLPTDTYVVISIEDNGKGIDREQLDRIFLPYFTTKGDKGSGLGLASSLNIIESNGGTIKVKSQPTVGSQFMVYLPLSVHTEDMKRRSTAVMTEGTIALIEDDKNISAMLSLYLSQQGLKVVAFDKASLALAEILDPASSFDLVITDQFTSDMTGLAMTHLIREQNPRLPVILISGMPLDPKELALDHFAFLPKPFELKELNETMVRLMNPDLD